MDESPGIRILFVCMGNTCRSTMCEGILRHLIKQEHLQNKITVDSAAVKDWQVGNPIDPRTVAMLRQNNIELFEHRARQITCEDFANFHYIIGMDDYNIEDLNDVKPQNCSAYIDYLTSFDRNAPQREIPDPFISRRNIFGEVFQACYSGCCALLKHVKRQQLLGV